MSPLLVAWTLYDVTGKVRPQLICLEEGTCNMGRVRAFFKALYCSHWRQQVLKRFSREACKMDFQCSDNGTYTVAEVQSNTKF